MKVFDSLHDLDPALKGAVIAIGNFDGVHRGHQALLTIARDKARALGRPLGVLTFEPHPRALLRPDDPPFRLTPRAAKLRALEACGLDFTVCLPFTWDFASQTAEVFIQAVLLRGLEPAHIVVGYDFRYGQMRKGTPEHMIAAGLSLTVCDKIADEGGDAISSSAIRQALRHGDIETATALLGRPWEIEGTVIRGDQRGRTIGTPTANIQLGDTLHPSYGIYATWVQIVEDGENARWLASVTNIGIRPMFEVPVGQVECHIFDFDRDIYGKTLRVRPVARLRGEARFESLDALIAQIWEDCRQARALLARD